MADTIPDPPSDDQPSTESPTACGEVAYYFDIENGEWWVSTSHGTWEPTDRPGPVADQVGGLANRVRFLSLRVRSANESREVLRSIARTLEAIAGQARAESER